MELLNKTLMIVFEDGNEHYSRKTGKVVAVDQDFVYLDISGEIHLIPKDRIFRGEVRGEG